MIRTLFVVIAVAVGALLVASPSARSANPGTTEYKLD